MNDCTDTVAAKRFLLLPLLRVVVVVVTARCYRCCAARRCCCRGVRGGGSARVLERVDWMSRTGKHVHTDEGEAKRRVCEGRLVISWGRHGQPRVLIMVLLLLLLLVVVHEGEGAAAAASALLKGRLRRLRRCACRQAKCLGHLCRRQ